jgi:hypothetical protein
MADWQVGNQLESGEWYVSSGKVLWCRECASILCSCSVCRLMETGVVLEIRNRTDPSKRGESGRVNCILTMFMP